MVGVDRSTVWRWLQRPEFAADLTSRRMAALAAVQVRLGEEAGEAVELLSQAMCDPAVPWAVRCRAAIALLDRCGLVRPPHASESESSPGAVLSAAEVRELERKATAEIVGRVAHLLTDDQLREIAEWTGDRG